MRYSSESENLHVIHYMLKYFSVNVQDLRLKAWYPKICSKYHPFFFFFGTYSTKSVRMEFSDFCLREL